MDNYLGDIRLFPYNTIPASWKPCNGQVLHTKEYASLFALLGYKYGGDNDKMFALPNLNGRVIMGQGTSYFMGFTGGAEKVALGRKQIPKHLHTVSVNESYDLALPETNFLANPNVPTSDTQINKNSANANLYNTAGTLTSLASNTVAPAGEGLAHENRMPFLALNYCICVEGYFPSPTSL